MKTIFELISRLLSAAIEQLEDIATSNHFNHFEIRLVGEAARILRNDVIADRAEDLLRRTPDQKFWAGAVSNFELPAIVPNSMRELRSLAQLERDFPLISSESLLLGIRRLSESESHLKLCLEGRYDDATSIASAGLQLEEVAEAFAVMGEFERAHSVTLLPSFESARAGNVRIVSIIELFRRSRVDEGLTLLEKLESSRLGPSGRACLALGLAGREPWGGYPFPDW